MRVSDTGTADQPRSAGSVPPEPPRRPAGQGRRVLAQRPRVLPVDIPAEREMLRGHAETLPLPPRRRGDRQPQRRQIQPDEQRAEAVLPTAHHRGEAGDVAVMVDGAPPTHNGRDNVRRDTETTARWDHHRSPVLNGIPCEDGVAA